MTKQEDKQLSLDLIDAALNNKIQTENLDKNVLIIGLGLIGGSLAMALKKAKWRGQINAVDANQNSLEIAFAKKLIANKNASLDELLPISDIIVLAVPVLAVEKILLQIKPKLTKDKILTDVGSCKQSIILALNNVFGQLPNNFIAAHPIAGLEKSGILAAKANLFKAHKIILMPKPNNSAEQVKTLCDMWLATEAEIVLMDLNKHDETLALTSHLPHLLAYSLVDMLTEEDERLDIFKFAAGGFRDFSRIAASDPIMWRDVFLANKQETLMALDKYTQNLANFRAIIADEDGEKLQAKFKLAKASRDYFSLLNGNCMTETKFTVQPQSKIRGIAEVPGDKSISHRSIMFGALAKGTTKIKGFLESEDALATLSAFEQMGVEIKRPSQAQVEIKGVGLYGLKAPQAPIYLGNSGTSMRLLAGILAGQKFDSYLTGDSSLSSRPMLRVTKPLEQMGANIKTNEGKAPLHISGGNLTGIDYQMPMASAQVKSAILLAGLYADGQTIVREKEISRNHTENMLRAFGYPLEVKDGLISLEGKGELQATQIEVPADISSAAFLLVAAAISPGSEILLKKIGVNQTRVGIINLLKAMGANLELENARVENGEEVADLHLIYAPLQAIEVPKEQIALAIDEFPIFFIAAACAEGVTSLRGAQELRVKESDRLAVMAQGLEKLGVECKLYEDGIDIFGKGEVQEVFGGGTLASHNDHRIAMSFAIASIRASANIVIENCATVASSFPNFAELMQSLGLKISVETMTSDE